MPLPVTCYSLSSFNDPDSFKMGSVAKKTCPVVQTKSIPLGDNKYEKLRASILQRLHDQIPEEYYLPQSIIDNPPLDVTDIPRTCGILSAEELEITENYDAVGLAEAIASKKYKAVTVAKAFCKRAAIAQQLTCCLTQFFEDEALDRAKYLDSYLEKNGKTFGPLHGVPVSVKEHMALAGHYTSYGYVSSTVKSENDCLMVEILRNAGAVFYCKSNQPQGIMHLESDSHYGRVNMPSNINLSAGGSTGGEAALIAMRASVLGLGTDIGGSVRGPSGFSGIHGFKPTSYTLTMRDMLPAGFPAELNILCSTGPMCNSLRDMDMFMSLFSSAKTYLRDPRVIPIPWTGLSTPITSPLKIGIMMNDGAIMPQPPVTAALEWAKSKVSESKDFTLKSYTPYKGATAMEHIRQMYWPEGGAGPRSALAATGEPMFPLTTYVLEDATSESEKTASEISAMRVTRDNFRIAFAEHWNEQDVDFVICPVFVGPASAHDTAFYWNYTALWNFVDYPGVVVPTPIKCGTEKEKYPQGYEPLSEKCKHVKQLWEETDFVGAPINLQVVGRRYHDNQLFAAMGKLQKGLGFA